jgi:antitoxin (DNA-binding transcriptional repressor) of toxin-antitoxin stability system
MRKPHISLYQAQSELPALLRRAANGEAVIIRQANGPSFALTPRPDNPNPTSREQQLLMLAMNADIESDLKENHLRVEERLANGIAKLRRRYRLSEEDARFAVEQWAIALQLPMAKSSGSEIRAAARPPLWELYYRDRKVCLFDLARDPENALAAIDRRHGLMWAFTHPSDSGMPPSAPMDWDAAALWISRLNRSGWGGFSDWRIPTTQELYTLLSRQPDERFASLPLRVFRDIPLPLTRYYSAWSSSQSGDGPASDKACFVNLSRQYAGVAHVDHLRYLRPVRGPLHRKTPWPFSDD